MHQFLLREPTRLVTGRRLAAEPERVTTALDPRRIRLMRGGWRLDYWIGATQLAGFTTVEILVKVSPTS